MRFSKMRVLLALSGAMVLGGCATVPREAGFADVEAIIAERTGQRVHWNQGTAADDAVDAVVRSMLAEELSADAAVQVALLNNRNLQAAYESLGVAQADLVAAGLLGNPVFDGNVRFSTSGGGTGLELALIQDFIDILFIPLRKRVAAAAFETTKLEVAGAVMDLAGQTRAAYFRLQAAQQLLELRQSVSAATGASAEFARRLRRAGNITELDLHNEQALYEESKVDQRAAEAEVLENRERLNVLLGVWGPATEWRIGSRLPDPPEDDAAGEEVERQAIERSVDLAAARRRVEAAGAILGITAPFGLLPSGELGAAAERETEGEWSVGPALALPIPLFNQGQPAIAAARAELRRARQMHAALAIEVRAEARAARNRVLAAGDRARYFRDVILPLRQQVVTETQKQYNAMFLSPFHLLVAKQRQIEAAAEYVEALREHWLSRAELEQILAGRLARFEREGGLAPTGPGGAEKGGPSVSGGMGGGAEH